MQPFNIKQAREFHGLVWFLASCYVSWWNPHQKLYLT